MFSQCKFDGAVYVGPKVDVIHIDVESILCSSISDINVGGNGNDDLQQGNNWEDLLR